MKEAAGPVLDLPYALAHGETSGAENGITKNAAAFAPTRLIKQVNGISLAVPKANRQVRSLQKLLPRC